MEETRGAFWRTTSVGEVSMTFKKIIGLACIVGLLSLFIFEYEIPRDFKSQKDKLFLGGASGSELSSISVTRGTESFTLLHSTAEGNEFPWQIASIPHAKLDRGAVSGLVDALTALELGDPIPEEDIEGDLGVYGLQTPAMKFEIEMVYGSRAIEFGVRSDFLGERYVRLPDSGSVFLIPETLYIAGDKPIDDYRDRTPIEVDSAKLSAIEIDRSSEQIKLQKLPNGWVIASERNLPASSSGVSELIRKLGTLSAQVFHDEDEPNLANYGLEVPDVSLTFEEGDKRSVLRISAPEVQGTDDVKTYFHHSAYPTIFETDGLQVGDFILGVAELMDRKVFAFNSYALRKSSLVINGDATEVTRDQDGNWQVDGQEGDAVVLQDFFRELAEVEVLARKPEYEVDFSSILKIEVELENDDSVQFEVGPSEPDDSGGSHLVRRVGRDALYRISEADFTKLLPKKVAFLKLNTPQDVPSEKNIEADELPH